MRASRSRICCTPTRPSSRRWEAGTEGVVWPKLAALMDVCGNDAPVLWMCHARGYDLHAMRKQESETQRGKPPTAGRKCGASSRPPDRTLMDNYHQVVHQMEEFGVEFMPKDLPLVIDAPKRRGCGKKGKWWYWLRSFRPDAGGCFVVGRFGSYKTGESVEVEIDCARWPMPSGCACAAERAAAELKADEARRIEAELAALSAADLWRRASRTGTSPYLERKGVTPEACRYLHDGSIVVPLLRYDFPRDQALRAVQRIFPDGAKRFTKGFAKPGCALRLGDARPGFLVLICEGYATGLTLRMATDHQLAVDVALDAGNLAHVVPIVRSLHPDCRMLICADDDLPHARPHRRPQQPWANRGPGDRPPGGGLRHRVAILPEAGQAKDTDFNDLHQLQGLAVVQRQLSGVLQAMEAHYAHG